MTSYNSHLIGSCTVTSLVPSEGRLDLDVVDHFGDPIHALCTGDDLGAGLHQFGHGAAVARALDDEVRNDGNGLGVVELTPRSSRRRATIAAIEIRSLSFSRETGSCEHSEDVDRI